MTWRQVLLGLGLLGVVVFTMRLGSVEVPTHDATHTVTVVGKSRGFSLSIETCDVTFPDGSREHWLPNADGACTGIADQAMTAWRRDQHVLSFGAQCLTHVIGPWCYSDAGASWPARADGSCVAADKPAGCP